MTSFEELLDIITRNKNKNKKNQSANNSQDKDDIIEVAGSESTKNPLITFGDSETDPDLLEQLRRSPNKPLQGFGADRWDVD